MILTCDIEDYKVNSETGEYEPVLDATGKSFVVGCVRKQTGGKKVFTKPDEMWEYLLKQGEKELKRGKKLTCYAHNAKFDFYQIMDLTNRNLRFFSESPFIASYFMEVEREFTREEFNRWRWYAKREKIEYEILAQLGDLIVIKYKKEAVKFNDTLSIFTMSLKKVGEIIGFEKWEMPVDIGKRITKKKIKEISKYCMRDCEVTLNAIKFLKEKLEEEGVRIRNLCTINQIGISYVLNALRKADAEQVLYRNKKGQLTDMTWKTKHKEKIHSAYRGGFVRAWKTGFFENACSIDFNSLYPFSACMMDFPDLRTEKMIKRPLEKMKIEDLLEKIGVARAIIINRGNELGLIPIRLKEKSYSPKKGKVMIGTWTHRELKEALKEGYEIINIEWSITWEKAENPLTKIFERLYKKRINSKNDFDSWFYKAIMNSSIGKFGQRRTDQVIVIDSVENTYEYLEKNYQQVRGIKETPNVMFVKKDVSEGRTKKYYAPIIPALVTAEARIKMYHEYKRVPKEDLLYTDTDSIVTIGDYTKEYKIGEQMGEFKVEKDKETGEELRNTRAIIWGTKSKAIGNNMALSGVFKSELKMDDFAKGKVKARKMLGLKSLDEGKVGEFVYETRDLKKQQKDFWKGEKLLEKEPIYIDYDIEDISFFKDDLLRHVC